MGTFLKKIRWKKDVYTENPVPVMKTGTPCAHILTRKTCFNHRENLFSLQGSCFHCKEPVFKTGTSLHAPVLPCAELQCRRDFFLLIKGSKSRKQIMMSLILPKNEQNILKTVSRVSFVHLLEESRTSWFAFEIYWPLINAMAYINLLNFFLKSCSFLNRLKEGWGEAQ